MLVELNQSLSRNRYPFGHVIVIDCNPERTIPEALAGRAAVLRSPWLIAMRRPAISYWRWPRAAGSPAPMTMTGSIPIRSIAA